MLYWLLDLTAAVCLLIVAATLLQAPTHNTANNTKATTKTVETATEPVENVCHLLALPAELRLEIYETILASTPRPSTINKTLEPSIMNTCHQIRAEMLESYESQMKIWDEEVFAEIGKVQIEEERFVAANLTWQEDREEREKFSKSWKAYYEVFTSMQREFKSLVTGL